MSRREIVVNTLLGFLLLVAFALPFFLVVLGFGYVLQGVNLVVSHLLPGIVHPANISLFGLLVLLSIGVGVRCLGKRHLQEAFLSFAIVPLILSMPFAPAHSLFGRADSYLAPGVVFLCVVILLPGNSRLRRSGFLLGAAIVGTLVAVNTGLLGSGLLANIAADFVFLGLAAWFVGQARQNLSPRNADLEVPLFPTQA